MHIPQPKRHTVRYNGEYSSVARARRRAEHDDEETKSSRDTELTSSAERRRLRRAWAQMIRRIYVSRQGETLVSRAPRWGATKSASSLPTKWIR